MVEKIRNENYGQLEKLMDVIDLMIADYRLFQHSRKTFLPAARAYLQNKNHEDYFFKAARERRARLGGASRWLYHHQKQTFEKMIGLLFPTTIPHFILDFLWQHIKNMERKLLATAR